MVLLTCEEQETEREEKGRSKSLRVVRSVGKEEEEDEKEGKTKKKKAKLTVEPLGVIFNGAGERMNFVARVVIEVSSKDD